MRKHTCHLKSSCYAYYCNESSNKHTQMTFKFLNSFSYLVRILICGTVVRVFLCLAIYTLRTYTLLLFPHTYVHSKCGFFAQYNAKRRELWEGMVRAHAF